MATHCLTIKLDVWNLSRSKGAKLATLMRSLLIPAFVALCFACVAGEAKPEAPKQDQHYTQLLLKLAVEKSAKLDDKTKDTSGQLDDCIERFKKYREDAKTDEEKKAVEDCYDQVAERYVKVLEKRVKDAQEKLDKAKEKADKKEREIEAR